MKLPGFGIALALACSASSVHAYSIKTYQGLGASRIQACTLAKQGAQAPDEEVAHGRLTKVSACNCSQKEADKTVDADNAKQWRCLVEAVHER
jgi:hypothetical protein